MVLYLFTYTFPNALDNFTARLWQVTVQPGPRCVLNDIALFHRHKSSVMALPPNKIVRTVIDRLWITERHAPPRDNGPSLRRITSLRNATDANGTNHTTTAGLILNVAYPILASFLAWILGLVTSIYLIRHDGHGRRPLLKEGLRFAINPAIFMTSIQYCLMILIFQTQVSVSYEVAMTGRQEDQPCFPMWRLAVGCWFLALGVGLTIVGVFGIAIEAGKWEEMNCAPERIAKKDLPPLCP